MSFLPLRYAVLPIMGFCFAISAVPRASAQTPATEAKPGVNASGAENSQPADPRPGEESSSVERDPFRACVAAHADDPMRHRNCDWDGNYSKGQ